ncbi:MAG: TraR/DksA family transcriptional regulator [Candidatus Kryptoniota bacterium]
MKEKVTIDPELNRHFRKIIERRMEFLLRVMYLEPDAVMNIASGEAFICSTCDMENPRCKIEPGYRCEMAIKEETEMKELELAMSRIKSGLFGICEGCGKFIGIKQLEKSPTRTYCDECIVNYEI